jgi:hypothetical protein
VTRNVNNAGNVTQVVVPGVPAACAGETISITLLNATGRVSAFRKARRRSSGRRLDDIHERDLRHRSATALMSYRFAVVGA